MSFVEPIFWTSAALLVYVYVGYPVVVAMLGAWRAGRRGSSPATAPAAWPTISVLVTAYNEAHRIEERLENLLASDYPSHKLEIVVGSDGSTDDTAERARSFARRGVRVIAFAFRRGKPSMLNDLVRQACGEIVVLADARQRFAAGALQALALRFADTSVGAVSGELMLSEPADGTAVARGVGFYWRYEKFIRHAESRVRSMVGATGAIYAIRRSLYQAIPADTVLDDVLIPMQVARAGYRVVSEPKAMAFDRVASTPGEEFTRKTRTLAGSFALLTRHPWLLDPRSNPLWVQTLSHKVLRLVCPALLAMLFVSSAMLARSPFFAAAAIAQSIFYGAALAAALGPRSLRSSRLFSVPFAFCLLNLATVVGFWRFATRGQEVTWGQAPLGICKLDDRRPFTNS